MFYNYKILMTDNEEILYLYVNSIYEFSSELDHSNKPRSLFHKVIDYINDMNINFNGKKVMLVVNGLIIGSIMLITSDFSSINSNNIEDNYISYNETIDMDKKDNVDVIDVDSEIKTFVKNEIANDNNGYIISNFVKMKNKEGKITYVDLNNYIINALSKIIPPTYEEEAIKSAAIITRTEVFRNLYENNYLSEEYYQNTHTLKQVWKRNYTYYFNKLKDAVESTSYQYLASNHYYFDFDARTKYQIPFSSYDANRLAKSGYKYIDILGHYYPDAVLETA